MSLKEVYEKYNIEKTDQISNIKPIMFVVPNKNYDLTPWLKALNIDKFEKTYTYPKIENNSKELITEEINAILPDVVIQLETKLYDEHLFIEKVEDVTEDTKKQIVDKLEEQFVNLHHHDEYSVRDGLGKVEDMVDLLKKRRQSFCCISNHGGIGGWLKQYNECKDNFIKPIFGIEGYYNNYRGNAEITDNLEEFENQLIQLKEEKKLFPVFKSKTKSDMIKEGMTTDEAKVAFEQQKIAKEKHKTDKDEINNKIKEVTEKIKEVKAQKTAENKENAKNNHLLLIAKNLTGFYNIIKLHNDAQLNGFYRYPRMNLESLQKWGSGIIASSACLGGLLAQLLIEDKWSEAKEAYYQYQKCFDDFYIELVMIECKDQVEVNRKLIQLAKEVNGKLIVTLDSHYLKADYSECHDILMLIRTGKTIYDKEKGSEEVWQFATRNLFYRNQYSLTELFEEGFDSDIRDEDGMIVGREHINYKDDIFTEEVFKEAILNTRNIALQVDEIKMDSSWKLPIMCEDSSETLKEMAREGLIKRELSNKEEYKTRLEEELKIICEMGFADYFLVMEKIIKDTKNEFGEMATGFGRGSAAGSLVSYCLELTEIDPIPYKLLFERFLDYSRSGVQANMFEV